jgi:hypothetical protein
VFDVIVVMGLITIGLVIPEKWTRWSMKADADPLRNGAIEGISPSHAGSESSNKGLQQSERVGNDVEPAAGPIDTL